MKNSRLHKPVMVNEVIEFLCLKKGFKVLDATVGCGGHASFILDKIQPDGFLIGVDSDINSLEIARQELSVFNEACKLVHANFKNIDKVLSDLNIKKIDAALFDLGLSSYQIEDPNRGFSFDHDGLLDMRMDPSGALSAYDIVNKCKREELEKIISDFGEERYFRRIAGFILEERRKKPINSTRELAGLIKKAVGRRYKSERIHPATRTFQGLRIAVNKELDNLEEALQKIFYFLRCNARIAVISFHSLEDRIVKIRFKESEKAGKGKVITKKPLVATHDEVRMNPRSRSAKLRIFENHG